MHSKFVSLIVLTAILPAIVGAQQAVVPIVELKFRGLLGGVQNGKWIAPDKAAPKLKSEPEFLLVGWKGVEEGGITLGRRGETEDVCQDFHRFEFDLSMDSGVAIGSDLKWDPSPRLVTNINSNNAVYKDIVADFLKTKGLIKPVVKISQAYRIDLEGDGTDEVLISATYYRHGLSSNAAVGDYSFVMLRKTMGTKVVNHLLTGDFITKKIDFGAPTQNEISAVADLNGDGTLEIVLHGSYYEGDFASAYEIRKGVPVEIKEFRIGCGV
jgi:hypothetical protein